MPGEFRGINRWSPLIRCINETERMPVVLVGRIGGKRLKILVREIGSRGREGASNRVGRLTGSRVYPSASGRV
jgi:hypothetical protein